MGLDIETCSVSLTPAEAGPVGVSTASLVERIAQLVAGPGLAIVRGAALADRDDSELTTWFEAVAGRLGRLEGQSLLGERLVEVADTGGLPDGKRGYQSSVSMRMHTDASDVAALLCLSAAEAGGTSLFVAARDILAVIEAEAPDLVDDYFASWAWHVSGIGLSGAEAQLRSPIFSGAGSELVCRYGSTFLWGADLAGAHLSDRQKRALSLFEDVALRPEIVLRVAMERGDSVWMNNHHVLHGREAFQDGAMQRKLLRIWLTRPLPHAVDPEYQAFNDVILQRFNASAGPAPSCC